MTSFLRLGGKRVELEEVKDDYRSRREVAMAEIQRLDTHVKALQVLAANTPAPTHLHTFTPTHLGRGV